MIELAAPPARAVVGSAVAHDHLDHLISRIAAGDRAAFRCLYAFMAMRVWRSAVEARLSPVNAVAVTRSTFVEVWHFAGAAARYDARDWIAALGSRRINDRLRAIDGNGGRGASPAEYDTHIDRELTALLGAGRAIVRTSPGVFVRIGDLDHALAAIAATTRPHVRGTRAHRQG